LTKGPEENTMLNKVVLFVIFGPRCIFEASKHYNQPTDVTCLLFAGSIPLLP